MQVVNYGNSAFYSHSVIAVHPFASKNLPYFGVDSLFRSGAPRSMKLGNTCSPFPYDVGACGTLP
jgi:hypothetical protein